MCGPLIIESRSKRQDQRDRKSLIEAMRSAEGTISYRWEAKSERLLWVADAVCGAVKEHALREDDVPLAKLQSANVIAELRYRQLS